MARGRVFVDASAKSIAEQSRGHMEFSSDPNGNDRTTNPAHNLFARQQHSVTPNTPWSWSFVAVIVIFRLSRHCPLTWGLGKGSIDENPSHRGFGFVRVQFAGAGWMYLPMRQWADATPLQQHPRYRAAVHGDMRPGRAFNRPNQSAENPAPGHTSCRQAQICDQFGNCRWQQVCR